MTSAEPVDEILRGDCGHVIARGARLWAVTRWDEEKHRFVPARICWDCMNATDPIDRGPLSYAPQKIRFNRMGSR